MQLSTSDTSETTSQPAGCNCSFSAARGSWNAKRAKESSSTGMCPGTESTQCAKETAGRRFPRDRPIATAAGRSRLGLWREPRDGALHGSTERALCHEVLCSVKPHSTRASLCTAAREGTETHSKMERRKKKETELR